MEEYLAIMMFPALLACILAGFPVAFTLAGTALLFALLGHHFDMFYLADLNFIPMRVFGVAQNILLMAVPLFVFMGLMLERSGLAADLLSSLSRLFNRQRGSLAISVVAVGAILAASTGIVGATVVTMGVLALPVMLQQGFDKKLSLGVISASGTLGQIIPPSIVLVILGDMMNVDVSRLFMGAILPGFLLILAYVAYIKWRLFITPSLAPQPKKDHSLLKELKNPLLWQALLPPVALMLAVLGSIFAGIASPTEAAACGATLSILFTFFKKRLSKKALYEVAAETAQVTSMVFFILVGAQFFGVVFRGLSGDEIITTFVSELSIHKGYILFFLMVLLFVLGFFLDFLEICFIVIPIIMPMMHSLGYDPLWLAILIAVNLQTSFLTPPFGFALFYLKGVAPKNVTTLDVYKGATPFVLIQIAVITLLCLFPKIVTFLPAHFSK